MSQSGRNSRKASKTSKTELETSQELTPEVKESLGPPLLTFTGSSQTPEHFTYEAHVVKPPSSGSDDVCIFVCPSLGFVFFLGSRSSVPYQGVFKGGLGRAGGGVLPFRATQHALSQILQLPWSRLEGKSMSILCRLTYCMIVRVYTILCVCNLIWLPFCGSSFLAVGACVRACVCVYVCGEC